VVPSTSPFALPAAHTARIFLLFFFNAPPPPEISTLSLHDALPISSCPFPPTRSTGSRPSAPARISPSPICSPSRRSWTPSSGSRSEEHTSELQSRGHLVCRLLLEKKKKHTKLHTVI